MLQRLLARNLSTNVGLLFGLQFRSPQDYGKPEEQQRAVPPHQKEMLWTELKDMFHLLEGVDQELVKKCALKNMALAFATFKKLYINYIKKDKEPNWDDPPQVKPYWEEFKQYKLSEEAQKNPNKPR